MWESRLPYVLQRFVGTNLLWEGELFENLRTKHPENTSSDESLYAELVRLIYAATFPVTFFASASTAAKWTCFTHHQMHDKRKMPILSKETFLESGQLFKKNFQGRNLDTCAASSTQCPNFRGLKSNAHKVNSFFSKAGYSWHPFFPEQLVAISKWWKQLHEIKQRKQDMIKNLMKVYFQRLR